MVRGYPDRLPFPISPSSSSPFSPSMPRGPTPPLREDLRSLSPSRTVTHFQIRRLFPTLSALVFRRELCSWRIGGGGEGVAEQNGGGILCAGACCFGGGGHEARLLAAARGALMLAERGAGEEGIRALRVWPVCPGVFVLRTVTRRRHHCLTPMATSGSCCCRGGVCVCLY